MGVLAGRGGGGGPGFATDPDDVRLCPDPGYAGPSLTANLPASAKGGGARNRGWGVEGGDGVLAGGETERGGEGSLPPTGLLDGGGAGGGPRRPEVVEPVFSGLIFDGGAAGGGGGGALDLVSPTLGKAETMPLANSSACFCWT